MLFQINFSPYACCIYVPYGHWDVSYKFFPTWSCCFKCTSCHKYVVSEVLLTIGMLFQSFFNLCVSFQMLDLFEVTASICGHKTCFGHVVIRLVLVKL